MQADALSFDCLIISADPTGLSYTITLAKQQQSSIEMGASKTAKSSLTITCKRKNRA